MGEHETAQGQSLCQACGLCCDGSLFNQVSLKASDAVEPLAAAGIRVGLPPEAQRFAQPCAAHRGGLCRVYENRPQSCRSYQCKLLKRLLRAEVGEAEAREIVRHTVQQRDELRRQLQAALFELAPTIPPPAGVRALFRRFREAAHATDAAAFRQQHQRLFLAYAILQTQLRRYFQEKKTARDLTG